MNTDMKKIVFAFLMTLAPMSLLAQKNITTFMGIPVNGTKSSVVAKLKSRGFVKDGHDCLKGEIENIPYLVRVMTDRGRVYRISVVEEKGTDDVSLAVARYNSLLDWFRKDSNYTEYEYNPYIYPSDNLKYEKKIADGWYYAEFFQKEEPQLYSRLVSFRITDEYGDYRIERCYENIYNSPERDR